MKQFIEAKIFSEEHDITSFVANQKELVFKDFEKDGRMNFRPVEVSYKVSFAKNKYFSENKIPLILPIKDIPELLNYTLNNLISNGVHNVANIVVVDDRSSEDIKAICDQNKVVSYMRIDNDKGFNYSMIANIAAYVMREMNFERVIYWNSDMWVPDDQTIPRLIMKHEDGGCVISGTKLLYPDFSWNDTETNVSAENEMKHLGLNCDYKGKVQFGGGMLLTHNNSLTPVHIKRFSNPSNPIVNSDYGTLFTTGAYSMINLQWLSDAGGFNPSLSKAFNDIDICLRANESKQYVMYFGKDTFLYHHESLNLNLNREAKFDHQFTSDSLLFSKLWDLHRVKEIVK